MERIVRTTRLVSAPIFLQEPAVKIAQVASRIERIPPIPYGEAKRVASYLTEELVR